DGGTCTGDSDCNPGDEEPFSPGEPRPRRPRRGFRSLPRFLRDATLLGLVRPPLGFARPLSGLPRSLLGFGRPSRLQLRTLSGLTLGLLPFDLLALETLLVLVLQPLALRVLGERSLPQIGPL